MSPAPSSRLTPLELPGETAPAHLVLPEEGHPEIRIGTRRPRKPAAATIVQQSGVTDERYTFRGRRWEVTVRILTTAASRWIDELTVHPR